MKMIRKKAIFIVFAMLAVTLASAEVTWMTDYKAAIERAKKENKLIMADFTGSDWCGWCIKLEEDIFSTDEFQKFAEDEVVPFRADYPEKIEQTEELKAQNKELEQKYQVSGFPTVLLIDPKTEKAVYTESGYEDISPADYVKKLTEETDKYSKGK